MKSTSTERHHVEHVMGMAVSIDVRDEHCDQVAIDDVVTWLHHVDETFSTYDLDTPISRLGRGDAARADMSAEVMEVLHICEELRHETDGAFDVFAVPAPNGTTFDPSGYVKGWSAEQAAQIMEHRGCANFCINAGGDVAIRGMASDSAPWRIGIRHPVMEDALALAIEVEGPMGVATTALYERGPHIVDPRTGEMSFGLASATVVGPDLGIADAYATTMFVMGLGCLEWIDSKPGYAGYIITNDGDTRWTSAFNRYLED